MGEEFSKMGLGINYSNYFLGYTLMIIKCSKRNLYLKLQNNPRIVQKRRVGTAQKLKLSIKDFFSKCDQKLRIWSQLLKKSLIEIFIFCVVRSE